MALDAGGVDPVVVSTILNRLKSQGIFDQFRRDCLADVDTKPAYQNLRQRVETYVSKFLSRFSWSPDMNKNQLRDSLRRQINQSDMLASGVDRIIEQVIEPKMQRVFRPQIEKLVHQYLHSDHFNGNHDTHMETPMDIDQPPSPQDEAQLSILSGIPALQAVRKKPETPPQEAVEKKGVPSPPQPPSQPPLPPTPAVDDGAKMPPPPQPPPPPPPVQEELIINSDDPMILPSPCFEPIGSSPPHVGNFMVPPGDVDSPVPIPIGDSSPEDTSLNSPVKDTEEEASPAFSPIRKDLQDSADTIDSPKQSSPAQKQSSPFHKQSNSPNSPAVTSPILKAEKPVKLEKLKKMLPGVGGGLVAKEKSGLLAKAVLTKQAINSRTPSPKSDGLSSKIGDPSVKKMSKFSAKVKGSESPPEMRKSNKYTKKSPSKGGEKSLPKAYQMGNDADGFSHGKGSTSLKKSHRSHSRNHDRYTEKFDGDREKHSLLSVQSVLESISPEVVSDGDMSSVSEGDLEVDEDEVKALIADSKKSLTEEDDGNLSDITVSSVHTSDLSSFSEINSSSSLSSSDVEEEEKKGQVAAGEDVNKSPQELVGEAGNTSKASSESDEEAKKRMKKMKHAEMKEEKAKKKKQHREERERKLIEEKRQKKKEAKEEAAEELKKRKREEMSLSPEGDSKQEHGAPTTDAGVKGDDQPKKKKKIQEEEKKLVEIHPAFTFGHVCRKRKQSSIQVHFQLSQEISSTKLLKKRKKKANSRTGSKLFFRMGGSGGNTPKRSSSPRLGGPGQKGAGSSPRVEYSGIEFSTSPRAGQFGQRDRAASPRLGMPIDHSASFLGANERPTGISELSHLGIPPDGSVFPSLGSSPRQQDRSSPVISDYSKQRVIPSPLQPVEVALSPEQISPCEDEEFTFKDVDDDKDKTRTFAISEREESGGSKSNTKPASIGHNKGKAYPSGNNLDKGTDEKKLKIDLSALEEGELVDDSEEEEGMVSEEEGHAGTRDEERKSGDISSTLGDLLPVSDEEEEDIVIKEQVEVAMGDDLVEEVKKEENAKTTEKDDVSSGRGTPLLDEEENMRKESAEGGRTKEGEEETEEKLTGEDKKGGKKKEDISSSDSRLEEKSTFPLTESKESELESASTVKNIADDEADKGTSGIGTGEDQRLSLSPSELPKSDEDDKNIDNAASPNSLAKSVKISILRLSTEDIAHAQELEKKNGSDDDPEETLTEAVSSENEEYGKDENSEKEDGEIDKESPPTPTQDELISSRVEEVSDKELEAEDEGNKDGHEGDAGDKDGNEGDAGVGYERSQSRGFDGDDLNLLEVKTEDFLSMPSSDHGQHAISGLDSGLPSPEPSTSELGVGRRSRRAVTDRHSKDDDFVYFGIRRKSKHRSPSPSPSQQSNDSESSHNSGRGSRRNSGRSIDGGDDRKSPRGRHASQEQIPTQPQVEERPRRARHSSPPRRYSPSEQATQRLAATKTARKRSPSPTTLAQRKVPKRSKSPPQQRAHFTRNTTSSNRDTDTFVYDKPRRRAERNSGEEKHTSAIAKKKR